MYIKSKKKKKKKKKKKIQYNVKDVNKNYSKVTMENSKVNI